MKRKFVVIGCFSLLILVSFRAKNERRFIVPKGWPAPVYNFKRNPLAKEKIALGRKLFYDPILSNDSSISCSSCHLQYTAFTHVDHALSHGIRGLVGSRNSPALMNLAWSSSFMWDGAVNHLDVQALAPMSNKVEMAEDVAHIIQKLQTTRTYPTLFLKAWSDSVITGERMLKSMSQFMLTLVSANARYDKVNRGEEQFTEQEQRGYALFKVNCNSCHTEPLFTNNGFENNGLVPDDSLRDAGRVAITLQPGDSFKFKVPTLRNIEYSQPYMHDGRFRTLQQVLGHYVNGIYHSPTLSSKLKNGIRLSPNDRVDLVAFLLTLTDKDFLSSPAFSFPPASR